MHLWKYLKWSHLPLSRILCVCVCFQQENYLNDMYIMSENYLSIFFGERSV